MLDQVLQNNELTLDFIPPAAKRILAPFKAPLLHFFKLNTIFSLYNGIERGLSPLAFSREALKVLDVQVDMQGEGFESIPQDGPLVVVSNHPFGALEGLVLMSALLPYRPDTQFLANFILGLVPELKGAVIDVDPFDTKEARRKNIKGLRSAISHVGNNGCLAVFPAGEVSHLQPANRGIMDPQWNSNVARIIRKTNATVLPLYFHGRNSMLFNMMGLVHPMARTVMLPSELLKKRGQKVKLSVGNIITPAMLRNMDSEDDISTYLRVRSYSLRPKPERKVFSLPFTKPEPEMQPVALARPVESLQIELDQLPQDQILLKEQGYTLFEARAFQIPNILHELGRVREVTFRAVGEGSGA